LSKDIQNTRVLPPSQDGIVNETRLDSPAGAGESRPGWPPPFLRARDGSLDQLKCGILLAVRAEEAHGTLAESGKGPGQQQELGQQLASPAAEYAAEEIIGSGITLTGAEAVTALLVAGGVHHVFAYAGTSELALCDAVDRAPGIELVNGRGDKECAFMAAGASLIRPNRGAAILHAARGLTNATGAVADARRNEAGTVFIVGLPSTGSRRFLPPHGEDHLLTAIGGFARWSWEAPAVPESDEGRLEAARAFVSRLREAIAAAARRPWGPVLFGIPQDVAEHRWLPLTVLAETPPAARPRPAADISSAVSLFQQARRPLFLIDDYALRDASLRPALDRISRTTGAPVLQLRYRRGPMLFERLQRSEVRNFVGWLNQYSPVHQSLLDECDLLVTVEDRNIYRRVAGEIPACRKIALNTDPAKVLKNEYLDGKDILIDGDPAILMNAIADRLADQPDAPGWFPDSAFDCQFITPEPPADRISEGREAIARAFADMFAAASLPVLVDDSQMFGGLLADHYDLYPPRLRVFGGHGGFVGGGLAYAIGLALAEPAARVYCTLGDQAFTNSFQALVAAIQQRARLLIVVCNNGESVSLNKQAAAALGAAPRQYLANVAGFSYHQVAQTIGVPAERVEVPLGAEPAAAAEPVTRLRAALERGVRADGPFLLEIVLPSAPEVWRGIWLTQGFEERAAVAVR
jgi:acetolactate synthase I/II/III large subunit